MARGAGGAGFWSPALSVGLVGLIVWLIFRLVRRDKVRAGGTEGPPQRIGALVALGVWLLVGVLWLAWLVQLGRGDLWALPKLVAGLVILLPWPTLRFVVMPLGMVRTAYYVAFLGLYRFEADRRGAALLSSAWTLLRRPARAGDRADSAQRFIEKRLSRPQSMRGAGVVALGLLAARHGELDQARALLLATEDLHPAACPTLAGKLAREWLSVDALAQGDWRQVGKLTMSRRPQSLLTRFLGACAARFVSTGEPLALPPSNAVLRWRWLRAPYRTVTWPLLQRAQHSTPQAADEPQALGPAALTAAPLPDLSLGLRALVSLLETEKRALTEGQLVRVCQTWEGVLKNPATRRKLTERALILGQDGPDAALRELRTQVAGVVGERLREAGLPIGQLIGDGQASPGETTLGATAAHAVRAQLLDEIELATGALHDRTRDKRALPIADEWREWANLLAHYRRVCNLGGMALRLLAWTPLYQEGCGFAVWLWNERKQKVLANAVFRFLLHEAERLGDEGRIPLARKNVACGI